MSVHVTTIAAAVRDVCYEIRTVLVALESGMSILSVNKSEIIPTAALQVPTVWRNNTMCSGEVVTY